MNSLPFLRRSWTVRHSPGRWLLPSLIFLVVSSIYFATISGITSSNDGSHYALVRALADRHSFEIRPYLSFTEHQDYALSGERRFSDRPPATALLAAPLYALGRFAPAPIAPIPSKHDPENARLLYAVMAAPLFAAASVTIFFIVLHYQLKRSLSASLVTTTALAFGTTTWKYGSVLYSHALAGLILWLGVLLALTAQKHLPGKLMAVLFGFTIGFAPLVEYTNVLVTAILGIDWLVSVWQRNKLSTGFWFHVGMATLGASIPITFFLFYNTVNFGGPFEISTFHVDTTIWPQNAGLAADFATPLLQGLQGMLLFGDNNQGLFLLAPISILSLLGLRTFWRQSHRSFLLLIGIFAIMLLVISKSTTFNSLTNDGRYLTPFVGLWLIPFAFWCDHMSERKSQTGFSTYFRNLAIYGLLFLSIRNQMLHIAFSWNYDLDLTQLLPMATSPQNISYLLRTVFPNTGNLPLLWLIEFTIGGGVWAAWKWLTYQHRKHYRQVAV